MANRLPVEAFAFYASLGPNRSYEQVAQHFKVTKRAVTKRASKEGWAQKLANMEAQARQAAETQAQESVDAMHHRQLEICKAIQARAVAALKSTTFERTIDAIRAIDIAFKHERLLRGLPTDRTAVDIERTIRREYETIMLRPGEQDDWNFDASTS